MGRAALASARIIIEKSSSLFIEIASTNTYAFNAWLDQAIYEVARHVIEKEHAKNVIAQKVRV